MPRCNTATPFGTLVASSARGELMGNRGILHNGDEQIVRAYAGKRWVACTTTLKPGTLPRPLMKSGHYTVLFFLDEATTLAAGHRPCFTCRRHEYDEFLRCWAAGNGIAPGTFVSIEKVDAQLHRERVYRDRPKVVSKVTHPENVDVLPEGSMIDLDSAAHLVKGESLLQWSPAGYTAKTPRPVNRTVAVLTPTSTVNALRHGYVPDVHQSANTVWLAEQAPGSPDHEDLLECGKPPEVHLPDGDRAVV